eukprot:s3541_g11.t1
MLHDCSCFEVSTPPGYRAMPGAGGEMTEVDYTGDGDVLTEVPDVPTVPPPAVETPVVPSASRVDEPETPVIATASDSASKTVKPKVKPMPRPRKTIGKRAAAKGKSEKPAATEKQSASSAKPKPAVKKMPRRIAVKQEKADSVRGRGSFRARQTEANRKRRHAWKARQKEAAEFFKKARLEEEQRPMDVHVVEHSSRGREVQKRSFNPATGRRETLNITLKEKGESANTKMVTSFRGFSKKPVSDLRFSSGINTTWIPRSSSDRSGRR